MPQKCEFRGVILLAHQRIDVDCQAEEQHTIHFVRTDGRTMDGSRVYVTLNMVEELEGEKPSQPGSCRACGRLQAPIAGVGWKCYYEGCLLAGRIVTPQRPEDIPSISNPAKRPTEKPPEPQPPKCCNRHKWWTVISENDGGEEVFGWACSNDKEDYRGKICVNFRPLKFKS